MKRIQISFDVPDGFTDSPERLDRMKGLIFEGLECLQDGYPQLDLEDADLVSDLLEGKP
jgi:hypothetical protein